MKLNRSLKEIIAIVLITIIGTYFFSYVAYVLIEDKFPESFLSIWQSWDTNHYLDIAQYWYTSSTFDERNLQIVFLPLYPLLTKCFAFIFRDYMFSALLVSNLAYIAAAYYLYKLIEIDFDKDDALRGIIYFSVFPTAYFLHAAYTESLFLALTIASFYYARQDRWAMAGVIGMLAASTRITGIILLPVLLVEYMQQRDYDFRKTDKKILGVAVIILGFLSYLLINYLTFDDPFKFLEIQKTHWNKHLDFPHTGILNAWGSIAWRTPANGILGGWAEVVFALLGLALIIYSFFKIRLSYCLYALITWLLVTSTSFVLSIPRYTLSMFPIFIVLALLGRRRDVNYSIIFISLLFYALLLTRFIRLQWAF